MLRTIQRSMFNLLLQFAKTIGPKELKRALMNNVQDFLMELGRGFAFVVREYRLIVVNLEY